METESNGVIIMIEAEIRSFVSRDQFKSLLDFMNGKAKLVKDDYQETFYFSGDADLRIQRSNIYAKMWLKGGKLHDEAREEIEIKVPREDFEKLERLFTSIGFEVIIKWFRERKQFDWKGIKVCLDYTRGYGWIIELEKLTTDANRENALVELKEAMAELGVEITPKAEFDQAFANYKQNWKTLTAS